MSELKKQLTVVFTMDELRSAFHPGLHIIGSLAAKGVPIKLTGRDIFDLSSPVTDEQWTLQKGLLERLYDADRSQYIYVWWAPV